jgi:hypothetical protein
MRTVRSVDGPIKRGKVTVGTSPFVLTNHRKISFVLTKEAKQVTFGTFPFGFNSLQVKLFETIIILSLKGTLSQKSL